MHYVSAVSATLELSRFHETVHPVCEFSRQELAGGHAMNTFSVSGIAAYS